ncbi:hypothetical protein LTR97_002775 [Elasticomyces elasticus]|uniref:DUF7730 domain-containing protein n=1 Tax=Elasticomyces elasticus TaxID=574655 RepID=A0AAN7WDM3_9PEZI|nr:hypothetical protein LTR97_002775 [Elasticomyces elasticus]
MTKRTAERAATASSMAPAVVEQDRPKKKSRRMKVLSTSKLSAQQKQIYESNASNSPLLRLAPEIRNRIFSILLGGKTIHVRSYTSKGSHIVIHSVCKIPGHSEETANTITRHNALLGAAEHFDKYEPLHSDCVSFHAPRLPLETMASMLPVLLSCRQIHQEAALLPYQLNNFMCPSMEWLGSFLQTLVPAQAHAIEDLTFSNTSTHHTQTFQKLAKTKLRGLKRLTCFVDFSHYTLYWGPVGPDKIDPITLSLLQFKSPALVTVSVLPYKNDNSIRSWRDSDPAPITRESMRTWALGVEAALLAPET